MTPEIIHIDKNSNIPLSGIDFFGIIDRGTNVIEIKPLTLCNLKCRYCFVSAGDYKTNFIVNPDYLIEMVKKVIEIKGRYNIEIHIAPYGEILLYSDLFYLIENLWKIEGIEIISMQTNGLLLNRLIINKLKELNLTRINISLNSLNGDLANYLCKCENYDIENLLNNINLLLISKVKVLLAPVWFPGENDKDIEDIIEYVISLKNDDIKLGIQKYLIYKTGRKLKKIRPKSWDYFYKQLTYLEKKYNIKLKLGPDDFGIHKRKTAVKLNLKKNDLLNVKVISKGRSKRECIGKINDELGIKILINKTILSDDLIGKKITVKVIKANYKDNIMTAFYKI